ncbi:hypothetical protein [Burkholderia cepacia]|uniref:hypothetical protein n=2 Tax=Burkholderia cepacia TaxID=292 RepID=UPI001FC81852|nr:hypothetical protein [Burkholderia cepacia]
MHCREFDGFNSRLLAKSDLWASNHHPIDYKEYFLGGGAQTLVAARSTYTGKLHRNQGDPGTSDSMRKMMTKAYDEQRILEQQVRDWTAELKRLAGQIAAARGMPSATVMITPTDEDYWDVIPELIAEDALQVRTYGWPAGFNVEILNQAD